MASKDELLRAFINIRSALDDFGNLTTGQRKNQVLTRNNVKSSLSLLQDHLNGLDAGVNEATGGAPTDNVSPERASETDGASSIEEFFEIIGRGARTAQENLDLESDAYMKSRPYFAPDTMFRLPKVTANLKLGMEQSKEKGINFFLFKRTGEESQRIEQEISFEVVAAPPPPDALEAAADLPIGQTVLSNPLDREAAFARLKAEMARQKRVRKKLSDEGGSATAISAADVYVNVAAQLTRQEEFRRVILFGDPQQYLLVYIPSDDQRDADQPEIGVKILTLPREAKPQQDVIAFDLAKKDTNPRTRLLVLALAGPADRQATLLSQLNRI